MEISIVTSLYYSERYIAEFYKQMSAAVSDITSDYEMIFVDDGSPDNSKAIIADILMQDPKVKMIELSKNFGAAAARWKGMEYASGDLTFLIDADLEENPAIIQEFYKHLQDDKEIDVVYGYLETRKGGLFERLSGWVFYRLFKTLTGLHIKGSPIWARLMRPNYKNALLQFSEQHLFPIGIMNAIGFKQYGIPIVKKSKGYSSYSFTKKLSQTLDSVISFSNRPLETISLIGIVIASFSFLFLLIIVILKLFLLEYQVGWTSLIASVFFIGGMNLAAIGIVGLYIGKTFQQTKARPRAIVKHLYNIS